MIKFFLSSLLVLSGSFGHAASVEETIEGNVNDVFCGELDPYYGDVCIVFIEESSAKSKMALTFDFDKFNEVFSDPLDGDTSKLHNKTVMAADCKPIKDSQSIASLKGYDSKYFYLNCETNKILFF